MYPSDDIRLYDGDGAVRLYHELIRGTKRFFEVVM